MKRKLGLLITLCLAMLVCTSAAFAQINVKAEDPAQVSGLFRMQDGASIRDAEPYGIRFTTEVGNDFTASLGSVHSGKTFVFGTRFTITDGEEKAMDIVAEKFVEVTDGRLYNTVITDIPESAFNTFVTAASYVKVYDGETVVATYYAANNEQTRSAAQVASVALANGETSEVLSEYIKNVENFAFANETDTLALGKSDLNDYLTVNPSKITPVYQSSDESVATVDKNGIVTAKKLGGQVVITAKLGSKTASCTFTVVKETIIPFEVFSTSTTNITFDNETGVFAYTTTATDTEYNARVQFTPKMFERTTEHYNLSEDYSVKMDFRFVGDVKNVQFFYIPAGGGMKDVTLTALVNSGTAIIIKDGLSLPFSYLVKGEWYTVYVDIHKFGEIAISNNDRGVQVGSLTGVEYKYPEFVKNSDIPAAQKPLDAFEVLCGCTVTTDYKTGITTYVPTGNGEYGSRAQFTEAMYNETTRHFDMQEDYSVKMEFRFVGDVKNVQFWYIPTGGGMKDVTLTALVNAGTATIVKDGYSLPFGYLVKGEWYTVYVDIHKFGGIGISNNDRGVQVASFSSVEYKQPEFVKNSDIPATEKPMDSSFVKISSGVVFDMKYKDGAFVEYYTGTSSDWESRIQLTENAFAKYTEYYNAGNAVMTLDIKYVGSKANIQFWRMNASGGYGDTPTLSTLISSGVVTVYKNGVACSYDEIAVGEWYTLQFDMSLFGALGTNADNHGFHLGAQTSMELRNFGFITK